MERLTSTQWALLGRLKRGPLVLNAPGDRKVALRLQRLKLAWQDFQYVWRLTDDGTDLLVRDGLTRLSGDSLRYLKNLVLAEDCLDEESRHISGADRERGEAISLLEVLK